MLLLLLFLLSLWLSLPGVIVVVDDAYADADDADDDAFDFVMLCYVSCIVCCCLTECWF